MADEISFDDVVSIYQGCLFTRKGSLVKFEEAFRYGEKVKVRLLNLSTGRQSNVIFKIEDFKAPINRIGYVNIEGQCAAYVERQPRRLYKAGLHNTNVNIRVAEHPQSSRESYAAAERLARFTSPEIAKAYNNEYPSLVEALGIAKAIGSTYAFDKQFAVSHTDAVLYKNTPVGTLVNGVIKFDDKNEYLNTLLDGNYEKDSRNFAARPL